MMKEKEKIGIGKEGVILLFTDNMISVYVKNFNQ